MILIIGGISEARALASKLAEKEDVLLSVATAYGAQLASGQRFVVISGKRDAAGFANLIAERRIRLVIDCSHPFAENVSREIALAAKQTNVLLLRYRRREIPYVYEKITRVHSFSEAAEAAKILSGGKKIFLATGSNHLPDFTAALPPKQVVIRVLDQAASLDVCRAHNIPAEQVLAKCGPFSAEENRADFAQFPIGAVVTKDSGAAGGTEEKIQAAKEMDLPVVLICPPSASGTIYDTIEALCEAALVQTGAADKQ